jgi:FG-GAP repeat
MRRSDLFHCITHTFAYVDRCLQNNKVVMATDTYQQVGPDIFGEAAFDRFGTSVSMSADGTTFVVGATLNNGNGIYSGHVRVYKLNSTIKTYTQLGLDIDGEEASDQFGKSVSISADGSTFAVGAAGNNGVNGTVSGHVRVYKLNTTINTYTQVGLDIDGEAANDQSGRSVSMSADGSTFVVGATGNNGVNGTFSGHVRVYNFNSTITTYTQVGLDIDGEAPFNEFGRSVSMSADGTTFVVGAIGNDGNGTNSGHVRVYKFNSTIDAYVQVGLDIDGEAVGDLFGSVSMSADGTTFVVGATGNNGVTGIDSGHVRVFKFNSTINTYVQVGLDIDGEAELDSFGSSVSMTADGTTFVVGATDNNGVNGTNSGHVRVYKFNSTINAYAQVGLDIDGKAAFDIFGFSVSMSANGTTFVVGAPLNDGINGTNSGLVRVYRIIRPTKAPTEVPSKIPTKVPTKNPTKVPTKNPTKLPTKEPTKTPTTRPTKVPTKSPTNITTPVAPPENCGLFGWNVFCPRLGKCGLLRRLLNLGNCD